MALEGMEEKAVAAEKEQKEGLHGVAENPAMEDGAAREGTVEKVAIQARSKFNTTGLAPHPSRLKLKL